MWFMNERSDMKSRIILIACALVFSTFGFAKAKEAACLDLGDNKDLVKLCDKYVSKCVQTVPSSTNEVAKCDGIRADFIAAGGGTTFPWEIICPCAQQMVAANTVALSSSSVDCYNDFQGYGPYTNVPYYTVEQFSAYKTGPFELFWAVMWNTLNRPEISSDGQQRRCSAPGIWKDGLTDAELAACKAKAIELRAALTRSTSCQAPLDITP